MTTLFEIQNESLRVARMVQRTNNLYNTYGVAHDGGCLCGKCCKTEERFIGNTTGDDGWCLIDWEINHEDQDLFCDHCGEQIKPLYE